MDVAGLLNEAGGVLRNLLERQILLGHVMKAKREFLIAHPEAKVSVVKRKKFLELVKKRGKGVPIAYLVGHKEFFALDFFVDSRVLIPRPETELLVESAVKCAAELAGVHKKKQVRMLDVGTGSGCVAVSLAKAVPGARVVASDVSEGALQVARKNIKLHKLGRRIQLIKGDLLKPFLSEKFDIIVANLPYIPTREKMQVDFEVKKYEPASALWAGVDGMRFLNTFFVQLSEMKRPPAFVIGEFGASMKKSVAASIKKYLPHAKVEFKKDYAGHDRIFILNL